MQDENEVARVLTKIAELLDTEVDALADSDALGVHPSWNSLAHVEILATLEDECGLVIDADTITGMGTFGSIRHFVENWAHD
jgi:acyl carrier protein